mmetsp:Transcript_46388/g.70004  ORF Transcript_46388/g.70004 Transcript_46388/m.70004 type:complete len:242 (+) Transcript_46388:920-1645(+)
MNDNPKIERIKLEKTVVVVVVIEDGVMNEPVIAMRVDPEMKVVVEVVVIVTKREIAVEAVAPKKRKAALINTKNAMKVEIETIVENEVVIEMNLAAAPAEKIKVLAHVIEIGKNHPDLVVIVVVTIVIGRKVVIGIEIGKRRVAAVEVLPIIIIHLLREKRKVVIGIEIGKRRVAAVEVLPIIIIHLLREKRKIVPVEERIGNLLTKRKIVQVVIDVVQVIERESVVLDLLVLLLMNEEES